MLFIESICIDDWLYRITVAVIIFYNHIKQKVFEGYIYIQDPINAQFVNIMYIDLYKIFIVINQLASYLLLDQI